MDTLLNNYENAWKITLGQVEYRFIDFFGAFSSNICYTYNLDY